VFARHVRSLWRQTSGTTAIEFAFTAPALIMLILGIVALGWAINGIASVRHALEMSGRALAVTPTMSASQFEVLVKSKVAPLDPDHVSTTLTETANSGGIKLMQATASYTFKFTVPFLDEQDLAYTTSIVVPINVQ
jgi:Flp pilus assembly protein TadG